MVVSGGISRVCVMCFFFLMIRRPPRSTQSRSSAASDVYKRQALVNETGLPSHVFFVGNQTDKFSTVSRTSGDDSWVLKLIFDFELLTMGCALKSAGLSLMHISEPTRPY